MDNVITRFWSIMVITLSQPIIDIKRQALSRIKLRSVNKEIRKIQKMHFDSQKKTNSETHSYASISDIKPLSNLYSSVKIYEEDFKGSQYQTKKQKIKHVLEESMEKIKLEEWMIARKAKVILPEDYPKSQFCDKSITNYSEEALNSIKMYKFEDFCTSNLKKKRTLFFKEKNMMKYKYDQISDSLTHLDDTKIQVSIDIFDLILYAGAEKEGTMPTVWYVWKFIHTIQQQGDDIKDEAYFQIVKQLSSNKKIYYKFLACMSATVQPSTRMYLPLLNYIYFHSLDPQNEGHEQYHKYMFFSLIKSNCFVNKDFSNPRKAPPSLFQVFCLMNLRKIPLLIRFPRENIFFMEPYSTVEQILDELIQLYGLNTSTSYLFNIQGILLEKGMILDGLNYPKIKYTEQQSLDGFVGFQGFRAFIVIKNMLEMNTCQQNFLIMYNYLVNQYRSGLFAVTNKSSFQIGGLIIASEVQIEEFYEFSLAKYLPRKKYMNGIPKSKLKQIENMIINEYDKFKGTKDDARKQTIEKLKKSRAFLTHFFLCNVHIDQQQVTEAWVGLKTQSIIVVEPFTSRVLLHLQYEKIQKWGKSKTELCLKIQQIGDLHIQSYTLDTLISIFTNYLKYLGDKLKQIHKNQDPQKKQTKQERKNSIQVQQQQ